MKKSSNTLTKKIIAGKYKGKVLKLPSLETTRSSKAIVVESFFNTIQFDVIDATFVELFSGSGSIGLEALSRGAKEILFMERDKNAIKTLKQNIAQTDPSATKVFEGDTFENISSVKKLLIAQNKKAFFYIDPPFSYREGMEEIYDKMIDLIENLNPEIVELIIVEHMSELKLPEKLSDFTNSKTKKFGKTSLTYYKVI